MKASVDSTRDFAVGPVRDYSITENCLDCDDRPCMQCDYEMDAKLYSWDEMSHPLGRMVS